MVFNLLLAIAMIYLVMAAVFESTVYPVSIITSIFMAIVASSGCCSLRAPPSRSWRSSACRY
jgi:HAE1 family hydrophobic/amphiphilic exporter-1